MYAYEIPGLRFSVPTRQSVERYRFVTLDTDGYGMHATSGDTVIGVSMNKTEESDGVLEVADGIVMVEAGEMILSGKAVSTDADGKAILAGDTNPVAGVAITSCAEGGLVAIKVK